MEPGLSTEGSVAKPGKMEHMSLTPEIKADLDSNLHSSFLFIFPRRHTSLTLNSHSLHILSIITVLSLFRSGGIIVGCQYSTINTPRPEQVKTFSPNQNPQVKSPVGGFTIQQTPRSIYSITFPLTHNLSLPPSLQVFENPKLKKLCASKLESGGEVCIGNNQPFLDADLSKLVTGSFSSFPFCYQDSDASTVCGNGTGGLFSSTAGCPSNAC